MAGDADLPKRMAAWEDRVRNYNITWTPIKDGEIFAAFGVKFDRLEDGSFVAKGDNATTNNYIVKAKTNLRKITGVRVEFLTDTNLPRGGPGRAQRSCDHVFRDGASQPVGERAHRSVLQSEKSADVNPQRGPTPSGYAPDGVGSQEASCSRWAAVRGPG